MPVTIKIRFPDGFDSEMLPQLPQTLFMPEQKITVDAIKQDVFKDPVIWLVGKETIPNLTENIDLKPTGKIQVHALDQSLSNIGLYRDQYILFSETLTNLIESDKYTGMHTTLNDGGGMLYTIKPGKYGRGYLDIEIQDVEELRDKNKAPKETWRRNIDDPNYMVARKCVEAIIEKLLQHINGVRLQLFASKPKTKNGPPRSVSLIVTGVPNKYVKPLGWFKSNDDKHKRSHTLGDTPWAQSTVSTSTLLPPPMPPSGPPQPVSSDEKILTTQFATALYGFTGNAIESKIADGEEQYKDKLTILMQAILKGQKNKNVPVALKITKISGELLNATGSMQTNKQKFDTYVINCAYKARYGEKIFRRKDKREVWRSIIKDFNEELNPQYSTKDVDYFAQELSRIKAERPKDKALLKTTRPSHRATI